VPSTHAIDIEQFVDLGSIDPIYFEGHYYLVPQPGGAKSYHLLRRALGDERIAGIGKVTLRTKERLAAVRIMDDALVLETMRWPDEIRKLDDDAISDETKPRSQEVEMARRLVDSMTADWHPEKYKDTYRKALLKLIERKGEGEQIEAPEQPERAEVKDLMEALRQSIEATKKARPTPRRKTKRKAS
jgi:DNA end-binding protein Ku